MPRRTTPPDAPEAELPDDLPPTEDTPPEATAEAATESGFFAWIRRLGLPRHPGWIGGVCAGVAERLGVDALLVRGVAVVLTVLGAPVALLYAIAWFLLPDQNGTIHARELGHGRVTRALPGIVGVFLLSFLPVAQGFWFAGAFYWGDPGWPGVALRVLWTSVVVVLAVVFVVWLARRAAASDVTTAPATTDDQPATVPTFPGDAASVAAAAVTPAAPVDAPGEPPAPPTDASAEELAVWQRSQAEWQRQRADWAAEQRRSDAERRRAEGHERAAAAFAAAQERTRIRRATCPRAGAGVVFLILGLALVSGALAAFLAQGAPATRGAEWIIGAAVLALVLGLGIVVVGLARRRSGFLSFLGILALVALLVASALPTDRQLLPPLVGARIDATIDGRYAQIAGSTTIVVPDRNPAPGDAPVVDIWQLSGSVWLDLATDATVRIELVTDASHQGITIGEILPLGGATSYYQITDGRREVTIGAGDPDLILRLWVGRDAWVSVQTQGTLETGVPLDPEPDSRDQWDENGEHVEPTPASTEGVTP